MIHDLKTNDGFSYDIDGKTPKDGYMVVVAKSSEWKRLLTEIDEDDIEKFIMEHAAELVKPNAYLGG